MGDFQILKYFTWFGLEELSIVIFTLAVASKLRSSFSYVKLPRYDTSMAIADKVVVSQKRYAPFCASSG